MTTYRIAEYAREVRFAKSGPMAIEYAGEWALARIADKGVSFQVACSLKEVYLRPLLGTTDAYRTKFEIEAD